MVVACLVPFERGLQHAFGALPLRAGAGSGLTASARVG